MIRRAAVEVQLAAIVAHMLVRGFRKAYRTRRPPRRLTNEVIRQAFYESPLSKRVLGLSDEELAEEVEREYGVSIEEFAERAVGIPEREPVEA